MGTQDQARIEADFLVKIVQGNRVFAPGANQLAYRKITATSEQSKAIDRFFAANSLGSISSSSIAKQLTAWYACAGISKGYQIQDIVEGSLNSRD